MNLFFEIIKRFCIIYTAKARNIHGNYNGATLTEQKPAHNVK